VGASSFGVYKTDKPNGSFRLSAGRFRVGSGAGNVAGVLEIETFAFHYVTKRKSADQHSMSGMDSPTFSMLRFQSGLHQPYAKIRACFVLSQLRRSSCQGIGSETDREVQVQQWWQASRRCLVNCFPCPSSPGIVQWSLSGSAACKRPTNGYARRFHCAPFDSKRPHIAMHSGPKNALQRRNISRRSETNRVVPIAQ
jgi:hypothetical protein